MEKCSGVTIFPTLPIAAVTPYECFVGQYSAFGLFVLEHYLRCRDRLWDQEVAQIGQWKCPPFPEKAEEINFFWNQLHERCASVWTLLASEERVRFVGLTVSFRIIVDQARSIGKRLVAILRDDRLGFELEDVNNSPNNSALVFSPSNQQSSTLHSLLQPMIGQPPPPPLLPLAAAVISNGDGGSPSSSGVSTNRDTPPATGSVPSSLLFSQDPAKTATAKKDVSTMTDPVIIRSLSCSSSESAPEKAPPVKPKRKKRVYRKRKQLTKHGAHPVGGNGTETALTLGEGGGASATAVGYGGTTKEGGSEGGKLPKRIRTAYIMFMATEAPRIRNEMKDELGEPGALGRYMGQLWKSMNEEDKRPYNEMVRLDKERYDREIQNMAEGIVTPLPSTSSSNVHHQSPTAFPPPPAFASSSAAAAAAYHSSEAAAALPSQFKVAATAASMSPPQIPILPPMMSTLSSAMFPSTSLASAVVPSATVTSGSLEAMNAAAGISDEAAAAVQQQQQLRITDSLPPDPKPFFYSQISED